MEQEYTKAQAIALMMAGVKMTHRYFTEDEWVTCNESGSVYILEDGVKVTSEEFWHYRRYPEWENGWFKFEK